MVVAQISERQVAGAPERIAMLKERLLSRHFQTDIERARYFTRAYKATEGQPACRRAALGLEETLRNMTIRIEDGERIVGSKSAKEWGGPMYLEASGSSVFSMLGTLFYGKEKTIAEVFPNGVAGLSADFLRDAPKITEEEYRELTEEILPYWKANCTAVHKLARWKEEGILPALTRGQQLSESLHDTSASDTTMFNGDAHGHVTIGIKKVLDLGFRGIAHQAAERLAALRPGEESYDRRKDFLESVQISANAACLFAERYATLAEQLARDAVGARKADLQEIADRCHHVPAEPPRSFVEALQAIWLTQAMVLIAYGDGSITAPGRVDQFLEPYFKRDLAAGKLTREQALEAIEEYYLKLATNIYFGPNNVTIGGVDKSGEDATGEVSRLFLEAHRALKGLRNGLAVRTSPKTPRDFLVQACEVHRTTAGLAFYSDEVVIRDLMQDGYSLEDARDYSIVGCVETTGTGNNNGFTSTNGLFPVTILEMALNEGRRSVAGWERVGPATPPASEMKSFEDVQKAFAEQLAYCVDLNARRGLARDKVVAELYPVPLLSATIEGCVESGEDVTRGGARYNHATIGGQALGTLADSLAAIKWAVFDKKILTMEELVQHLRNNFEGAEDLRRRLLNAPKYGNDDPYADELALWVADLYNREITKHPFWLGGRHRTCMISALSQTVEGALCGATPDGRLAKMPISNGLSPSNGADRNGMTATLRSGAFVSSVPISDGTAFNIMLNPSIIRSDEGVEKLASMVEAYFALGGRQVQFNPMSKAMLLDAQENPANYSELNVKVSGFSMRFIDLPKALQDDIIARTEYTEM